MLMSEFAKIESTLECCASVERVPSGSNCLDGPSRLGFGRLEKITDCKVRVITTLDYIEDLLKRRVRGSAPPRTPTQDALGQEHASTTRAHVSTFD